MTEDEWKELTSDALRELMEEPPHGENHGRKKNEQGGWTPLETDSVRSSKRLVYPTKHGTTYGYVKQGCRCDFCRLMWAQRQRERRV